MSPHQRKFAFLSTNWGINILRFMQFSSLVGFLDSCFITLCRSSSPIELIHLYFLFEGVIHEADIVALLVSVILYVVLMAVLDATKMSEINNLWEDIMSWKKTGSQKHPRLLQALANVRSFIRTLGRRFPSLHYRLELGSDLGEAAVRMLKQSYGMSVSHRIELAGRS